MKLRSAISGFSIVTVLYLGILLWLDSQRNVFENVNDLLACFPALLAIAFLTFLLRYVRWYWLLARAGRKIPIVKGCLAYLSGFAFTATPGKVGELVRIRYFLPFGIQPEMTLSMFVYERVLDLLVVLALSSFVVGSSDVFYVVFAFVLGVVGLLSWFVFRPRLLIKLQLSSKNIGMTRAARVLRTTRVGLSGCRSWLTLSDIGMSLGIGFVAWGVLALAFVYLCRFLGIPMSLEMGVPVYPISMLAGAASMIPGGLASTESTIIAILISHGSDFSKAVLAAVGIRLATLWFSICCGLVSVSYLECFATSSGQRLSD